MITNTANSTTLQFVFHFAHSERRDVEDEDYGRERREDRCDRYIGNKEDVADDALKDTKPFYSGSLLDSRVTDLRDVHKYVHCNWDELFTISVDMLKNVLKQEGVAGFDDCITRELVDRMLSTKRWRLSPEELADKDDVTYEAIQIYTSTEGYKKIYGMCNKISRNQHSASGQERLRLVFFLTELVNIDIYNYILKHPDKQNFEGVVYRGQTVTSKEIEMFRTQLTLPIHERYIATPLGLISSTKNIRVAKKFIKGMTELQAKSGDKSRTPMLYKIHVVCVKQEYIDMYKSVIPTATMYSTYAVDIQKLSRHPEESEVLLRAPFLQFLELYQDHAILDGSPCEVFECVMVNIDRDLKSLLGMTQEEDQRAREIMRCIVTIARSEFAEKYCREKDLLDDAELYGQLVQQNKDKLKGLLNPEHFPNKS